MEVKLHRCSDTWFKWSVHPCWRVQKALDEARIEYELVKHPVPRRKRLAVYKLSGQWLLPVIELEGGVVYRAPSKQMAERIRSGRLTELADEEGATAETAG